MGEDEDRSAEGPPDPGELLSQARAVRRRARMARHAYWFPLVLFGLLTCASIPLYARRAVLRPGIVSYATPGPWLLRSSFLGGFGGLVTYYWLAAILLGVAGTVLWYRWRGDRVGLRTPTRGYLLTGLVLLVLALLIPVIARYFWHGPRWYPLPGDLVIRGTFPFVIVGAGLCVLAWAERSIALTAIAAGYLGLSLVASLYDIVNILYRLGWHLGPAVSGLPNVVLPGLVLLISGAGAWVTQRRHRGGPAPLPQAR